MLQAYALCEHLRSQGINTELIDYEQPATTEYYRLKWGFPPPIRHWLRLRRGRQFVLKRQHRSSFHCTSVSTLLPHVASYTHLITGSDQVWFTGPVQYYDPVYFLDFPFAGKKISYAPSAGGIDSFGEFSDRARIALRRFEAISVRDSNTHRLVRELTGDVPTVVSDPTFLHNFAELIRPAPPVSQPYLALFGAIPAQHHNFVRDIATKLGLRQIVSLQYPNTGLATVRLASPSPEDWLTTLRHAGFVATTYFHGTVFAIKFRRRFVSIPTDGRVKKVSALLRDLTLQNRLVLKSDLRAPDPAAFVDQIDWTDPQKALDALTDESKAFLLRAIGTSAS